MDFGNRNKVDASFNMSAMTDMVFLLLVFFMLTSNFASPSGLDINPPASKASKKVLPSKITINIDESLNYRLNTVIVPVDLLEDELRFQLKETGETKVVINADEEVPIKYVVKAAGTAVSLGATVSYTVKPAKK